MSSDLVESLVSLTIDVNETSLSSPSLPPIRVINFNDFGRFGQFPRLSSDTTHDDDQIDLIKIDENDSRLCNINETDPCDSFYLFISHSWLGGCELFGNLRNPDWRGIKHPDSISNDKFKLCIQAISLIKKFQAPHMTNTYIWFDYSCINQDENPAAVILWQLDQIVHNCDAILTPIHDPDHKNWDLVNHKNGLINQYYAKSWNGGYNKKTWDDKKYSYVNRAWCRTEMFFAANIPLKEENSTTDRLSKFALGLLTSAHNGRRPHYLYGTREFSGKKQCKIVEPLINNKLEEYNPVHGEATDELDKVVIKKLMDKLKAVYMKDVFYGYRGTVIERDSPDGPGIYLNNENKVWEGSWRRTSNAWKGNLFQPHGQGTYYNKNGIVYEGEFKFGQYNGEGSMIYPNGSRFKGHWLNNLKEGRGLNERVDGNTFDGEYKMNKMYHGTLKFCSDDGFMENYTGYFYNDLKHGKGRLINGENEVFDGYFEEGVFVGDTFVATLEPELSLLTPTSLPRQTKVCRHFQKSGYCNYEVNEGSPCKFSHKVEGISCFSTDNDDDGSNRDSPRSFRSDDKNNFRLDSLPSRSSSTKSHTLSRQSSSKSDIWRTLSTDSYSTKSHTLSRQSSSKSDINRTLSTDSYLSSKPCLLCNEVGHYATDFLGRELKCPNYLMMTSISDDDKERILKVMEQQAEIVKNRKNYSNRNHHQSNKTIRSRSSNNN